MRLGQLQQRNNDRKRHLIDIVFRILKEKRLHKMKLLLTRYAIKSKESWSTYDVFRGGKEYPTPVRTWEEIHLWVQFN